MSAPASASSPVSSPSSSADGAKKRAARSVWIRLLKSAVDADSWGQSLEATEQYEKMVRSMESNTAELDHVINAEEKAIVLKIAHAINLRIATLQGEEAAIDSHDSSHPVSSQKVSLEEIRNLQTVLDDLFTKQSSQAQFPIELKNYSANALDKKDAEAEVFVAHDDHLEREERGSLLQPPKVSSGLTTLSIQVEKIGLKDAQTYINGFVTVSVVERMGRVIESQDTPKSNQLKPYYVQFGSTVHIQTTVEDIQNNDLTLFFEFKHWKPKKQKISTRCFAILEAGELKKAREAGNAVCLELYKKPTDFSKRNLSLFTIKQLYLHVALQFTKH